MPSPDDALGLDEVASAFSRACRLAAIPHAFVGGLAVVAWGRPRTTSDIDVLVRIRRQQIDGVVTALREEGLEVDDHALRAAFDDPAHVTVFADRSDIHIDMVLTSAEPQLKQIEDAVEVQLPSGPVPIVRPEDTIAYKVLYGTEQDIDDARSILARRWEVLDRERLGEIARRLKVEARVEELKREVGSELGK